MNEINLKQIITDYSDCVTNGAKLRAILLDIYPDIAKTKAIVNTLVAAVNLGIFKEIVDSENITELNKSRWQQKLENEGFSEKIIDHCFKLLYSCVGCRKTNANNNVGTISLPEHTVTTQNTLPASEQASRQSDETKKPITSSETNLKNITVGSIIKFGSYWQGKSQSDGKTPIEWRVLAKCDNKALLISEKALDCKPFNQNLEETDWGKSTLRNWLNHFFLNAAFNKTEQSIIQLTNIVADRSKRYSSKDNSYYNFNRIHYIYPCDTTDKVFLLDIAEANKYFNSDEDRKCTPTTYAYAKARIANTCKWWLRSPGFKLTRAAFVISGGTISCLGDNVDITIDVRPALWIRIDD